MEGRSNNPVSLLLDALQKPEADLGMERESLLQWERVGARAEHVVLGRGAPGGVWHSLAPNLLTVSLAGWMELPGLSLAGWCGGQTGTRTSVQTVAQYYQDYVRMMGLEQQFRSGTVVTGVRQVCTTAKEEEEAQEEVQQEVFSLEVEADSGSDLSSQCSSLTARRRSISSTSVESVRQSPGPPSDCLDPASPHFSSFTDYSCSWDPIIDPTMFTSSVAGSLGPPVVRCRPQLCRPSCPDTQFEVTGYEMQAGGRTRQFRYLSKRVVLATGQTDQPNRLGVPGEESPFVRHSLAALPCPGPGPTLIVGAGLSAADAVITARAAGLPVLHVFRKSARDPGLVLTRLPAKLYPEYHTVHRMMSGEETEGYTALQQTEVTEIRADRRVLVRGPAGKLTTLGPVSQILVLIGSSPDLTFLGELASRLGVLPGLPISRANPIDVDPYSHEARAVPGLYAMGPLTGDNFVRFIQGGALAITNHHHHQTTARHKLEPAESDLTEPHKHFYAF